ncbi:MAG: beta-glucosidase BglX [Planctomycetota bacterium]
MNQSRSLAWVSLVHMSALLACTNLQAQAGARDAATDDHIEKRIAKLLAQMTLEEKTGQLTQATGGQPQDTNPEKNKILDEERFAGIRAGAIGSFLNAHGAEYTNKLQRVAVGESRLKIPLVFANDVIHGYRTIFPIPLGETASWDPAIAELAAKVAADEASSAGTHWTFAPMVDVARDPRWGRIAEGAGEDPYLGSVMARARVRGFQGNDLAAPDTVLACAKHFAAYGAAEGGRDYNTVDMSLQTLWDIYLPPFKACVDEGVGSLMSAFNEVNGIPATANAYLLDTILRKKWQFPGIVVSDWESIEEMVDHGYSKSESMAGEQAIIAGVDMDMSSFAYKDLLAESVRHGRVDESIVDEAVRRVLRTKFKLGLFERPYADPDRERKTILSSKNREIARDVARHSIVLLKNEDRTLPLNDSVSSIAVIGPLADSKKDVLGTWVPIGKPDDAVTVLEGIRSRAGKGTSVHHAKGCDVRGGQRDGIAEAVALARKCDVVLLVVGESEDMSGEAHCRTSLDIPDIQKELIKAVHATGVPTAMILMNGRPMSIGWSTENMAAILETWHLGVECGHAVADVVFGDFNPGGKLPVTFPRTVGQIPIHYNHKRTGRPPQTQGRWSSKYLEVPSSPLYPFGYGLSYTTFAYSNLSIGERSISPDGELRVSAIVTNTGDREGDEVVQLYVRDLFGSATRPVRELKGFQRITLQPEESRAISFTLPAHELGFHNEALNYVVEPGEFQLWIGPNSTEGLEGSFAIAAK